jgi:hypothetical protein
MWYVSFHIQNEFVAKFVVTSDYIGCPTRYRTQHFFNNRLAGWLLDHCSVSQQLDTLLFISHTMNILMFKFRIIKEMPVSVASGTNCVICLVTCSFVKQIILYFSDDVYVIFLLFKFWLFYLCNISLCSVPDVESALQYLLPSCHHIPPR